MNLDAHVLRKEKVNSNLTRTFERGFNKVSNDTQVDRLCTGDSLVINTLKNLGISIIEFLKLPGTERVNYTIQWTLDHKGSTILKDITTFILSKTFVKKIQNPKHSSALLQNADETVNSNTNFITNYNSDEKRKKRKKKLNYFNSKYKSYEMTENSHSAYIDDM